MTTPYRIDLPALSQDLGGRLARAYVDKIRPRSRTLRTHLGRLFDPHTGDRAFLSTPLIQGKFGYESTPEDLTALGRRLLNPALVRALDVPGDYGFPRDRHPYTHQLAAWESIIGSRKGAHNPVIVSSGTGSGKTECFLVPILDDLYGQAASSREPLVGVQALMLYPLNALIDSQKKRLAAWTEASHGRVRFCLYNGQTPESVVKSEGSEIRNRRDLRATPPPILVTNVTMLEYMLIRPKDAPIRQGEKLRYIVLDEAHTYGGSNAAEIALLLRRVMLGFGVRPEDVTFIATSATFGDGSEDALRDFMAGISGRSTADVKVIQGHPQRPALAAPTSESWPPLALLEGQSPVERHATLVASRPAQALRDVVGDEGRTVQALKEMLSPQFPEAPQTGAEWLRFFDQAAEARPAAADEPPFLPVRAHLFGRTLPGLWACANAACPERPGIGEAGADWPYGRVFTDEQPVCECGHMVFPLIQCDGCGAEYLDTEEDKGTGTLRPARDDWRTGFDDDDDEADEASDAADDGEAAEQTLLAEASAPSALPRVSRKQLIRRVLPGQATRTEHLDRAGFDFRTGKWDAQGDVVVVVSARNDPSGKLRCVHCDHVPPHGATGFTRPFLSPNFALAVTTPTLLAALEPKDSSLPSRGRRLLTFTDSRQGTAWYAARQQQDAELQALRSLVYRCLWTKQRVDASERTDLEGKLQDYLSLPPGLQKRFQNEIEGLQAKLAGSSLQPLGWEEVRSALAGLSDIRASYRRRVLQHEPYEADVKPDQHVHILLLREFARRPVHGRSLETLGLARLVYFEPLRSCPKAWEQLGGTVVEWNDFLHLGLDLVVRAQGAIQIDQRKERRWMGTRHFQRQLLPPNAPREGDARKRVYWRAEVKEKNPSIFVSLFKLAFKLNDVDRRALAGQVLQEAWNALVGLRHLWASVDEQTSTRLLDLSKVSIAPVDHAWLCPATRRLLPVTLRGYSPYALALPGEGAKARPFDLPVPPEALRNGNADGFDPDRHRERLEDWLAQEPRFHEVATEGAWGERGSRVVAGEPYYVVAEHTAQIEQQRLRDFEALFDRGEINVLSCSTTMEMGIDLKGLSAVAMTNAPPSQSNFMQRAGRAGRRGEPVSVSFTLCRPQPHDLSVFLNPEWILKRTASPRVLLDSAPIVQRHINAFALSQSLPEANLTRLACAEFFGEAGEGSKAGACADGWVSQSVEWDASIQAMIRGSALAGLSTRELAERAAKNLRDCQTEYHAALRPLESLLGQSAPDSTAKDDQMRDDERAALAGLELAIERQKKEFLLGFLASRQFLPAHGFPLNVVVFNNKNLEALKAVWERRKRAKDKKNEREERFSNRTLEGPSRPRQFALAEYGPGAKVVIDGLLHESRGLLLHWHAPPKEDDSPPEVQDLRFYHRCGACERVTNLPQKFAACSGCGLPVAEVDISEYLEPSGFAVDFLSEPHNNLAERSWLPTRPDSVDVGSEAPHWLSDGRSDVLGYRHAPTGEITYLLKGVAGNGYALCLRCGRAEEDCALANDDAGIADKSPWMVNEHRRLRGRVPRKDDPGSKHCDGPGTGSVRRRLNLGARRKTDVLELRFRDPRDGGKAFISPKTTTSLMVALREAAARLLGTEARELEFMLRGKGEEPRGWLFDSADGGAGLCSQLREQIIPLLQRARQVMDCPEECTTACHACLLGYSTQHQADKLDRHAAIEWFDAVVQPMIDHHDVTAPTGWEKPTLVYEPLLRRMTARIAQDQAGTLLVFPMFSNTWAPESLLAPLARLRRQVQTDFELVVALPGALGLSEAQRAAIVHLHHRLGLEAVEANPPTTGQAAAALWVPRSGPARLWTTREPLESWPEVPDGEVGCEWVVPASALAPTRSLDLSGWSTAGTHDIEIRGELDGPLLGLGERFVGLLGTLLPPQEPIARVFVTDRYLKSPLVVAALAQVIRALPLAPGAEIEVQAREAKKRSPYHPEHAWSDPQNHHQVMLGLMRRLSPSAQVTLAEDIPHYRLIRLTTTSGRQIDLRLDQGFGFLSAEGDQPRHDFNRPVHEQVAELASPPWNVFNRELRGARDEALAASYLACRWTA